MNVLVLSDYGVSDTSMTTDVSIDEYIDLEDVQYIMYTSGYASIVPYALRHEKIINSLSEMPGVDVYKSKLVQDPPILNGELIPEKLKYGRGANTQDILIVAKPSFRHVSRLPVICYMANVLAAFTPLVHIRTYM